MGFSVETKTLLRLEWHELVEQLRRLARTPVTRERLADLHAPFATDRADVLQLQILTQQADSLLGAGRDLPVGDLVPLDEIFGRVGKGGSVTPRELRDVASACDALTQVRRLLDTSAETAPELAAAGASIVSLGFLADKVHSAIAPDGVILDSASHALAQARSETQRLAGEGKRRMEGALRDETLRASLADSFYTVRNDRFVLPVRSDARGSVPGIVHDASASGATLFVEPSGFVELNNRHKRSELEALREERRIIAALSDEVARAVPELRAGLEALAELDLIFARAKLSHQLGGVPPDIRDEGVIEIRALRHPLLGTDAVPNDLSLGGAYRVLVISGPNAGGKTVAMKAAALAALCVRAGLYVPAEAGARVDIFDEVLADIGDEQDIRENLSTFSAHMANLAGIVRDAGSRSLVLLDEIGVGTDPSEGAALAQATLEALAESGACVITTTHYNLLKELAEVDERFENAAVSFDAETLRPTYELRTGFAGTSSALSVAERMGMLESVSKRARALLAREDRQLDRMIAELATSRTALETERAEAARLREESESTRHAYGRKLEQLEKRREKLFAEMREELQASFSRAHEEVAGVIRNLQRSGTAQAAAKAREQLLEIADTAERAQPAEPQTKATPPVQGTTIDWAQVGPGYAVLLPGGQRGVLVGLPDKRDRVQIQAGAAKLTLPAAQLQGAPANTTINRPRVRVPEADPDPVEPCDLRGERVLEAEEKLEKALEQALAARAYQLTVIHGFGTGALRRAVRELLQRSPYVERFEAAQSSEGGQGSTVAYLRQS